MPGFTLSFEVVAHRVEQPDLGVGALQGETARRPAAGVELALILFGRGKGRELNDRPQAQRRAPFGLAEIELIRPHRAIDRRAGARGRGDVAPRPIEIGDRVEPMAANLVGLMIERDAGAGQIVEQGFEPLVIERQPVLHADIAPPGADRFIKRVVGAGGAELLAITLAKPVHRLIVEQDFADRAQHRLALGPGRALAQRVEAAHAFERVAKEIEP